ncbi:pyruvate dehydrogenase [Grosmannia clavigera kw1407]|uniref:Protein-serine/threonine kinase n=1 Tax=Grosmannia clavigera (strain kw1407 / UAMH 11150) TaxID=655863 RepID=F0XD18_GROCL|nr:pyruvate dehydrogenase [Grosmannia clavigera kw1407]EFX04630.1 pyruvate dehydrogenase [Grosmannia clavigera kw1407]
MASPSGRLRIACCRPAAGSRFFWLSALPRRSLSTSPAASYSPDISKWRPISVLDDWVAKEARPISLRQLMVFGRSLTEARLISSGNYVRTELPIRLAHRIRDIQQLPYAVVSNPHISAVYELYYDAFDRLRRLKEIRSLDDNDALCTAIGHTLQAHLPVIPKLAMGILESSGLMGPGDLDKFMNTILRSRISRRVIAEQHLALTETFGASWYSPGAPLPENHDFIGEVFLKCAARDVIERCANAVCALARSAYGPHVTLPRVQIAGHLDTTFPYILSHIEYIVGELLRNAVQAVVEKQLRLGTGTPPPIEVTICEAQQHIIIRVSDQGGGVSQDMLPYLWSFSKGEHSQRLLENLQKVPRMSATLQELQTDDSHQPHKHGHRHKHVNPDSDHGSSLSTLSQRPPNLRLGMGLPLSRVYAEYWAGSLELHSLEGYGVDVFLQISKLGNKNEQLTRRASMDAV